MWKAIKEFLVMWSRLRPSIIRKAWRQSEMMRGATFAEELIQGGATLEQLEEMHDAHTAAGENSDFDRGFFLRIGYERTTKAVPPNHEATITFEVYQKDPQYWSAAIVRLERI